MASKLGICNQALLHLGAEPISSIDEANKKARALKAIYDDTRDEVLRDHPWNFAIKRAELAQTAAPEFKWTYAYAKPADCLRPLGDDQDTEVEWAEEGETIVTNKATFNLKYIRRVTTEALFDAQFCTSFALRLASKLAYPIAQNASLGASLYEVYKNELSIAKASDAQSTGAREEFEATDWINSRG